ncbi:MAG: hypothetical protein FJ271_28605 [Planctomycetes bacterium]|nr:hypothetical protein [Planctomycetota bacterium]
MSALFERDGIRFRYPENWQLEPEDGDNGWTVAVYGPGTAILILSLDESMPEAEHMADTALGALREDYPDLEADPCMDTVANQPAYGHDIRFFSLDLTNTSWTRALYSAQGTLLVMSKVLQS